ncbi:MAG: Cysteine desulfurase IscS [Chlamydiia bacterium]|nr:Cysteine desulfurase IscS [Chlamydiia bacterium]
MSDVLEKEALYLLQRKKEAKKIKRAKEYITDLIGAKKETPLAFISSKEEVLLRCLYEILAPKAMRSGKNEILIAKGESKIFKTILTSAGRLGLSLKEVEVDETGRVTKKTFEEAITKRTLGCFMSWTEEYSGSIHAVAEISQVCREQDVYLLVDATDCIGKVFFRWQDLSIDSLIFTKKKLTTVVLKKPDQMQKDKWGENFLLEDFYKLSEYAQEAIERMDMSLMDYSSMKNDVMERLENSLLSSRFFNRGGEYLPDRWCFAFDGVPAENLAYMLCANGIEASYLGVKESLMNRNIPEEIAKFGVSFKFTTDMKIFDLWDKVVKAVRGIKEFTYE